MADGQYTVTAPPGGGQQQPRIPKTSYAPAGLNQGAAAQRGYGTPAYANSYLSEYLATQPADENTSFWYTGANKEGVNSGWDTSVVTDFVERWNEALEAGTAADYFSQEDATGFVTWEHERTDPRTGETETVVPGDVFKDGKKIGNVFDQYDENTANRMMAEFVFDADTKARIYSSSDRDERLDRELKAEFADRTENFENAMKAVQFEGDVEKQRAEIEDKGLFGLGDEAELFIGGGAGGALLGGGAGAAFGALPGGIIGGVSGFLVGGTAALLNQDALVDQAARAKEVTRIANETEGRIAALTTGLNQWAGFGSRLIAPLSNLTQGIYDAIDEGDSLTDPSSWVKSDNESAFYRTDAQTGEREAPLLVRGADVVATVGDSLLQFASGTGIAAYSAQMSATIAGEVGQLAVMEGKQFDYRTGEFDNIFTDDEGNFDPLSAAAGIGKIGIDVVQLGFARGLAGKANAQRAYVGEDAAYGIETGLLNWATRGAVGRAAQAVESRLPLWMGGSRGLAEGQERVRSGGFSFTRNIADDTIVEGSRRATLGLLAPSEMLGAVSAGVLAMRTTGKMRGALSADDFYRASQALASGERRIATTLVNAMGEGYEEAVQAVLEPLSHNADIDWREVGNNALYGFAAGAGQGIGVAIRSPNADQRMFADANLARFMRGLPPITEDEWKGMSSPEKRTASQQSVAEKEIVRAAWKKMTENQANEATAGVAGTHWLLDAIASERDRALAKAADRTDGAFVITQIENAGKTDANGNLLPGSFPANAVVSSAKQLALNLADHLHGAALRLQTLQEESADLAEQMKTVDGDTLTELSQRQVEVERTIQLTELELTWGQRLDAQVDKMLAQIYDPTATDVEIDAKVEQLNRVLRLAFERKIDTFTDAETGEVHTLEDDDRMALARAVSLRFTRDPQDQSGSYQILVPQASAKLTAAGADHLLEISHAILPAIRGDYDGDKIRQLNALILSDTEFAAARAGQGFIGAGNKVQMGAPKWEAANISALAEAHTGALGPALQSYASGTLTDIGTAVKAHYKDVIPDEVMDGVLAEFYSRMRAGDKDARDALINGLADQAGGAITEFATSNLSNEWIWLDQVVVSKLQRFQEAFAAHRPKLPTDPVTGEPAKYQRLNPEEIVERHTEAAATLGATMNTLLEGDSLFRMSQKLHYGSWNSNAISADSMKNGTNPRLVELALMYKEMGQGVSVSDLELARGKDRITQRAMAELQRWADRLGMPVAVVANLQVIDLYEMGDREYTAKGEWRTHDHLTSKGKYVSVAQLLLKRSVQRDMRDNDAVLAASPELQAKYARLMAMTRPGSDKKRTQTNAQRAFVELFGGHQMYELLGEDSEIFGPHLTVEQFTRYLTNMGESRRRDWRNKLRDHAAYLDRKGKRDLPYSFQEVLDGKITEFRSITDAILAVASSRVTIDAATGHMTGEMVDRSNRTTEDFYAAHASIQQVLQRYVTVRTGETRADAVRRIFSGNSDRMRALLELLPKSAANVVMTVQKDGSTTVSNWIYEMLAEPDAARAHHIYWRETLWAEWMALGVRSTATEEGEAGEAGRRLDRMPRRMHRKMALLSPAVQKDGGLQFERFFKELYRDGQTTEEFLRWVNTTPGIRGDEAPFVAWVDDVAEFDVDKAAGGWSTNLQGAERREAVAALRRVAADTLTDYVEEEAAERADTLTVGALEAVLDYEAGRTTEVPSLEARNLYARAKKALEIAGETGIGIGPTAMIEQTFGAVRAFNGHSHTKGDNPENVNPLGAFEAQRDAFDYTTNFERQMAALTTLNLGAVGNNMGELARDRVRTMDEHGNVVETNPPSVAELVRLMKNPETRPLARSMVFPTVMEKGRDGQIRPRLLTGKSLTSLLDRTSLRELYPKSGKLSLDAAMRYLSMVETYARNHGGHFSVQRLANDLAIARTSAADHQLTAAEQHDIVVGAYYDIARVLQESATVAAENFDPESDPLAKLLTEIRKARRSERAARALGVSIKDREDAEVALQDALSGRRNEINTEISRMTEQVRQGEMTAQELADRTARLNADLEATEKRVKLLLDEDMVGQVVDMFSVDPAAGQPAADKRKALTEYVLAHGELMERATSVKMIRQKLTNKVLDGTYREDLNPLTPKEWDALSRAVIAVYLDSVVSSGGMSVSPFPDADHEKDYRYYDTSYSYLVEDLFDRNSPLVQAAVQLHRLAGRQGARSDTDIASLLNKTIYKEHSLGPWTSDIPQASIQANERIDSSSAPQAISMPGNLPKRQGVESAATRRTFLVPDATLLSTAALTMDQLYGSSTDVVDTVAPGGRTISTPLIQLNNRFASQVWLTFTDPTTGAEERVDLMAVDPDLGRVWPWNTDAANSGYKEIHLSRVQRAIERLADERGFTPDDVQNVEISYFHPDTQPASPQWANNLFFEGTSFKLDGDNYESLNSSLFFAHESINPQAQQAALDASKLGKPALQVIKVTDAERREQLEKGWENDFAGMLRRKSLEMFATDLGDGTLEEEFFNAVYKKLKLRHYVKATHDGQDLLLSAEQVIELQMNNPTVTGNVYPHPETGADLVLVEMWIPSDEVLRSMLGELGSQGVDRVFNDQIEFDLHKVRTWKNSKAQLDSVLQNFAGSHPAARVSLEETSLVHRGRQQMLQVRAVLDDRTRSQMDTRMVYFDRIKQEIWQERFQQRMAKPGDSMMAQNFAKAVQAGKQFLEAESIAFDWSQIAPFIGPRSMASLQAGKLLLKDLENAIVASNEYRTGWIYDENSKADPLGGTLNKASISGKDKGNRVAPEDLVVINLDSFEDDLELAKKRIDYFTTRGAFVVLGHSSGANDLRVPVGEYLEASGYGRIAGSPYAYQPIERTSRYVNQRARSSTLLEYGGVSPRNFVAVFNVTDGIQIQENAGWVRPNNERLVSIAEQYNLVPVNAFVDFNVPRSPRQIEQVRQQIRGLDARPEAIEALKKASGVVSAEDEALFDQNWARLMQRLDNYDGVVLPQPNDTFGLGDIIPLVSSKGELLFYRHGMKAPFGRAEVNSQLNPDPEATLHNVAIYGAQREPAATVHTGRVVRFDLSSQYGLRVNLNVDLQEYGDKVQLEWNGMKFVLAPMGSDIELPDHGIFPGWGPDIVVDAASVLSKEATLGFVDNHRNAFAYFGIDFTADIAEFFFPGKGSTAEAQRDAREMLQLIYRKAPRLQLGAAEELIGAKAVPNSFIDLLVELSVTHEDLVPSNWINRLDHDSNESRIALAMIVTIMTGVPPQAVLASPGFSDTTSDLDGQTQFFPRLFTQYFDMTPLSDPLRLELNKRFNRQIDNKTEGLGYVLHPDFTFETRMPNPKNNLRGFLQFAEAHSSGDNPVKNAMAAEAVARQQVSYHSAAIASQATGAQTAYGFRDQEVVDPLDIARAKAAGKDVYRWSSDDLANNRTIDAAAWDAVTRIDEKHLKSVSPFQTMTTGEAIYMDLQNDALVQFRQTIPKEEHYGWEEHHIRDYKQLTAELLGRLGLKPAQRDLVDFWIRQLYGMPAGLNDAGREHYVTGQQAVQGVADFLEMVNDGYLPLMGGEVAQMHVHDLQAIYTANKSRPESQRWAPKTKIGEETRASTWQDWVHVALGTPLLTENEFDPLYRLAFDAFRMTYAHATTDLIGLPVSMSPEVTKALMDEDTGRLLLSVDANINTLNVDPLVVDSVRASLSELLGGRKVDGSLLARTAPASEIAKRRADRRKWRAQNGVPVPVKQTLRDIKAEGARFVDRSTKTNTLMRMLVNLRVGTALINPALYMSMGPEQWVRGSLDRLANIFTGQGTTGVTSRLHALVSDQVRKQQFANEMKSGEGFIHALYGQLLEGVENVGLMQRFTADQQKKLAKLYETMGQRSDFRAMVYKELHYLRPYEPGQSKLDRGFEAYARFGSKLQDPTWGMKGDTLARRYVEAALQHILATPTLNNITVDSLIAQLQTDPTFLATHMKDAHTAASAAIAQIRSLKMTPVSLALRGIYEPLSEHSNAGINVFGTLLLKLPLMFSGYAVNVATTLTGMQGASDWLGMWLHGREKQFMPKQWGRAITKAEWADDPTTFRGRIAAKLRGEAVPAHLDMSEVIEGIDLTRSFIRGGLTHTGLFVTGMLAGTLGLSGEDDEARKRRLMAEQQGVGVLYDPNDIRNDIRSADMLYLDWLPYGTEASGMLNQYAPHWMLKQFISPIMGMEKFFQTGDFRHVTWGFQDAVSSFPLINQLSWSDAVATAEALAHKAAVEQEKGDETSLITSLGFLTNAVWIYERMLFENAFANAIYVGADKYDRDPYKLPLRDSDGELQLDIEGNPRPQNIALDAYLDPISGLPQEGYKSRGDASAALHALTENRFTLAAVMSLGASILPGEADFFRYAMPIKQRVVEKDPTSRLDAERAVISVWLTGGGAPLFTQQEMEAIIKADFQRRGEWWDAAEVEKLAAAEINRINSSGNMAGMSIIDGEGREQLTLAGARAIMDGLRKQALTLDSEALQGIHISNEMREKIAAEWSKELVQEGVDLGLTQTQAWYRMKRVMSGPPEDPSVPGLADILWDDRISSDDTRIYNQLNTTYTIGPDGKPLATGITREGLWGALGLKPLQRLHVPEQSGLTLDSRGNIVDNLINANTGLRAVEVHDKSHNVPTDKEIADSLARAFEEALKQDYSPSDATKKASGSGWGSYGGGGYGSRRRGGGYGSSPTWISPTRMYALPHGVSPYGNTIPFINTSNPIIRRADVRRERVWSERGRLKQWQ